MAPLRQQYPSGFRFLFKHTKKTTESIADSARTQEYGHQPEFVSLSRPQRNYVSLDATQS